MTSNRTRLLSLVTRQFGTIVTSANDPIDTTFDELNGDSLDRVSLIVEIEDAFGIEISDAEDTELGSCATLRDMLRLVEAKLGSKVAA